MQRILKLAPSKALSIRALYLPFLNVNVVVMENIPNSDDFKTNLNIVKKIGLQVVQSSNKKLIIKNEGLTFKKQYLALSGGNSGLGTRFLITLLSFLRLNAKIIIGKQLAKRHVLANSEHLFDLGIKLRQKERILYVQSSKGKVQSLKVLKFKNSKVSTNVTSQYLSALLFFGWRFGIKKIQVSSKPVSYSYIKTTIEMLKLIGVKWIYKNGKFLLKEANPQKEVHIFLPPDASIASNFLVLSCILKKKIVVKNFRKSAIEPDFVILNILQKIGARYKFKGNDVEFYGNIKREYIELNLRDNPDLLPSIAILLLFLKRGGILKNISHTQFKESPRNRVLIQELSKFGIKIRQDSENLYIPGLRFESFKLGKQVVLDCHNDHRIFMAFTILKKVIGKIRVKGSYAVRKSFPDFLNVKCLV